MTDPLRRLTPVVRLAPAKLNLTLAVVGMRPDGFHALHSVMVPLELADRLSFAPAAGHRDTLHLSGHDLEPGADNLVLRAIAETRGSVGAGWSGGSGPPPALAVRLEKAIPVAAGLGGGSSDAAAAIDGALEAWAAELPDASRLALAARLGSDVPFFLAKGAALIEGRGERVTPLRGVVDGSPGVLLVTPRVHLATADIFAVFAGGIRPVADGAARLTSDHLAGELESGLTVRQLLDRAAVLASANDLLRPTAAVLPELVSFRRALARVLGRPVGQSGSGPTCWALYPSRAEAESAAQTARAAVDAGKLPRLADDTPFIAATAIPGGPDGAAEVRTRPTSTRTVMLERRDTR